MTRFAPALLQLHLEQAALLAVGWLLFWTAWRWTARAGGRRPALRRWRTGAVLVMTTALLLPLLTRLLPRNGSRHGERRWSHVVPRLEGAAADDRGWAGRAVLAIPPPHYRLRFSSTGEIIAAGLLAALTLATAVASVRLLRRRRALRVFLEDLPVLRRHRRVTIAASDVATVPFAARAAGRAWIVVPTDLVEDPRALRMLLAHELQHHRQRDLHLLALIEALRSVPLWSPAATAWKRLIEELQELACDEAVVAGGRERPREYAELLLQAAGIGGRARFVPRGVSAASGGAAATLRRRIAMLMTRERQGAAAARRGAIVAAGMCLVVLAAAAVAARSAVLEKKVEAHDVSPLAEKLGRRGVPVAVNDVLLAEVNRWVATPKERAFLRESRQRLEAQRAMVEAALARHRVPSALAAVAIVESGFRNLDSNPRFQGAGVWQFIPGTARLFGLRVDGERDERMDVERQTEAAARYLALLHKRFDDWPLALAGYNEGGEKVQTAIEQAGTRDAWELMRTGRLGRYAATVMAAALVLEDEERLRD